MPFLTAVGEAEAEAHGGHVGTCIIADTMPLWSKVHDQTFGPEILIVTATSTEEVIFILQKKEINLVMTDMNFPNLNGLEFVKIIGKETLLPILTTSAQEAICILRKKDVSINVASQIKKARDSFCPAEMLSFIRKLATTPTSSERKTSLDFIKNNATTLAYRSSVYEEFDPTYAEAFGVTPVRRELRPASELSRAPLSGSLLFADSRSGKKSLTKATKPKEQSKKDRYLSSF